MNQYNFNSRSKGRGILKRSVLITGSLTLAGIVYAAYSNSEVLVTTAHTSGASISADGSRIAYRELGSGTASSIKVRYGGTTYTISGSLHHVGRPRISRDGLYVAFYGATASNTALKPYGVKIGNSPVQLGDYSGGDTPPAVSNDLGNGKARYSFIDVAEIPGGPPPSSSEYRSVVVEDAGTSAGTIVPVTWLSGHLVSGSEPAITADGGKVFMTYNNQIRFSESSTSWNLNATIVSTGASGTANAASRNASCSADGRYVAFASAASNLGGSDAGGNFDVFVRDRTGATTTRAYTGNDGSSAVAGCDASGLEMSSDGTFVAFYSGSEDIVGVGFCSIGQSYVEQASFVSEWSNQTTEVVSFDPDGSGAPECMLNGIYPSISDEADHVGFQSDTPGIVSGDNDGYENVLHKYTHT